MNDKQLCPTFTLSDIRRDIDLVLAAVERGPVFVTRHGNTELVIMSYAQWQAQQDAKRAQQPQVGQE